MADVFTVEKRSAVMSRIRSRGNESTELTLARAFRAARITGWRRHLLLPGKPDFTFSKQKLAVFVHGCFWHGCWKCYRKPTGNQQFWADKLAANRRRDAEVCDKLRRKGYNVLVLWECDLHRSRLAGALERVTQELARS